MDVWRGTQGFLRAGQQETSERLQTSSECQRRRKGRVRRSTKGLHGALRSNAIGLYYLEADGVASQAWQEHGSLEALRQLFNGGEVAVLLRQDDGLLRHESRRQHLRRKTLASAKPLIAVAVAALVFITRAIMRKARNLTHTPSCAAGVVTLSAMDWLTCFDQRTSQFRGFLDCTMSFSR